MSSLSLCTFLRKTEVRGKWTFEIDCVLGRQREVQGIWIKNAFRLSFVKQLLIRRKENTLRIYVKPTKLTKARENAGNQVVIGFSFVSDWLREWREFSGPIT